MKKRRKQKPKSAPLEWIWHSGPFDLNKRRDREILDSHKADLERGGIEWKETPDTLYVKAVRLWRRVEGVVMSADTRRRHIKSTAGNALVNMNGGRK